jgi:hypothetical protein
MFLHSVHSVLMLHILYSVLFMYYCLRTTATGIGPIPVGNKYTTYAVC